MTTHPVLNKILSDSNLFRRLGAGDFGCLVRLFMISTESADLPGSVTWSGSMDGLAVHFAVGSRKTAASIIKRLVDNGCVARIPGRPLGANSGSTPSRLFVIYGGLISPSPGHNNPSRALGHQRPLTGYPTPTGRHLTPIPSQGPELSTGNGDPVLQLPGHDVTTSSTRGESYSTSNADSGVLVAALSAVGWHGAPPRVKQREARLIAQWLTVQPVGKYRNPAGWLRNILSIDGEAESLCAAENLYGEHVESTRSTAAGIMSHDEWVKHEIEDPKWSQAVRVEALRQAQQNGLQLSMLLIRTVASGVDVSEQRRQINF